MPATGGSQQVRIMRATTFLPRRSPLERGCLRDRVCTLLEHGVQAFSLAVLELVEQVEHLAVREQYYLDLLKLTPGVVGFRSAPCRYLCGPQLPVPCVVRLPLKLPY